MLGVREKRGLRETVLRERHSAHGRREIRRRDRRLKHTRFGGGGRMGAKCWGTGKTQLCEIRCCAGDTVRMGGARRGRRDTRLKHTRFRMMREDGREMLWYGENAARRDIQNRPAR